MFTVLISYCVVLNYAVICIHYVCFRELPAIGHRWFEFNDTMVQPITEEHITKMFQGKQSAYMLFYRRQHLPRPSDGINEYLLIDVVANIL